MAIINIKQEYLLPFHIRIFGILLVVFGLLGFGISLLILVNEGKQDWLIWLSPLLFILATFITFTHYRLIIDPDHRTYTVLTRMPLIKSGQPEQFNHISNIYINPVKETTTYTTRSAMRYDSTKQLYKAFMKLDNGEKIHLDTDSDEQKLEGRVDKYIEALGGVYQPSE